MEPAYWEEYSGVSVSSALVAGVVSIVSLSAMLFIFPSGNISVSSFSLDDRKWASGKMAEAAAAVAEGASASKIAAYMVTSLSNVTVWSVAPFLALLFISLLLFFSVPVFFSVNIFLFQRVVNKINPLMGEFPMKMSYFKIK